MSDINIKVNVISQSAQAAVSGIAKDAKKAEKNFKGLNVSIKRGGGAMASFAGNLAAIGASRVIGFIGRQFSDLVGSISSATQSLETITTQFEVLTGSAGAANAIIRDLQEFSASTPFQFESIAKAGQRLLSFGFTAEEVKSNLTDLGDVAAASGADIGELSLIYGQVAAAGKLTGERLLQLQERAIPIGPALAKATGQAESSIKKLVSEGKIDLATFEKAFQSLNDEGEFAFDGMTKRSKTLEGRISTLKDNFQIISAEIGTKFAPIFKVAISAVTEFLQSLSKDQGFQGFLTNLKDNIPNAIAAMGTAILTGVQIFNGFRKGLNFIQAGIFGIISTVIQAAESFLRLGSAVGQFLGRDTSGIDAQIASLEGLKNAATDTAADIVGDNFEIEQSQARLESAIGKGVTNITTKYREEAAAADALAKATVDAESEKVKAAAIAEQQRLEVLRKANEDKLALKTEFRALEDELKVQEKEKELLDDGEVTAREAIQLQILADQRATAREEEALLLQKDLLTKKEYAKASTKVAIDQLKRENAIKKAKANADEVEKREKLKTRADTFQGLLVLSRLGNEKLFKVAKTAAIANATVAGFEAIQASAKIGFPQNIPGIIIETARLATTIGGIKSQSFQDGGIVAGNSFSGDNISANVNSGEMILNRQQQATLFDLANGQSGGGQVIEVTSVVQIDEAEVGRAVSRQVANGLALGEGGV